MRIMDKMYIRSVKAAGTPQLAYCCFLSLIQDVGTLGYEIETQV